MTAAERARERRARALETLREVDRAGALALLRLCSYLAGRPEAGGAEYEGSGKERG